MRRLLPSLLACAVAAPGLAEDLSHPGLLGSGLLTLPGLATLAPGRVGVAFTVDNRDRDPLGLDLLDGSVAVTVGVGDRAEAYGRAVVSRVVAMPEPPVLPPPPLDIIVASGAAAPSRPFYSLYAPVPYVNKRGTARFDDFVPGDAVVGAKLRLREPRGASPGLAVAAELTLPLSRAFDDLESGSGTGGVDAALRVVSGWRAGVTDLVASASYGRIGSPARGDRILRTSGAAVIEEESRLELPDRLELGAGARRPLTGSLSAVVEASTVFELGTRTYTLDRARPLDLLGGLQGRFGRVRVAAALRYHAHALRSGEQRVSPLAGFVDLTDVSGAALESYLSALGAGAAGPLLRPEGQRVLAPPPGAPAPPPGARVIPGVYTIRSEHQVGFLLLVGWVF
jgi:hypothetical protein